MNLLVEKTLLKLEKINNKKLDIALKTKNDTLFEDWKKTNMVLAEGWALLAKREYEKLEMNKETSLDHVSMDSQKP